MAATIDCWFEFGSNYSYLSVMRIEDLAARAGVPLRWQPFLLGPIYRELGWQSSPFLEQKEKGEYAWRDTARCAAKYGLPFVRPTAFPRRALLPLRVALLGRDQAWAGEFCRHIMLQNWAHDREIDDAGVVLAAPTFMVEGEMFWGDDRLEDALEYAQAPGR